MLPSLILENVSVRYPVRDPSTQGWWRRLGLMRLGVKSVAVLRNVWLSAGSGDRIAIIGRNGSGKSTLLKAMAGVYPLATGRIWSKGVVAPIFSATAGFVPHASGRENIYIRGMLMGMSKQEVQERFDEIRGFADIGEWIEQPVMTYSSGMALRLAFAICTCVRPDILLVDEWIGAGDAVFMRRARERLEGMIDSAGILLMASHSDAIVRTFCSRAIVVDGGALVYEGGVDKALAFYKDLATISASAARESRPETLYDPHMFLERVG